MVVDVDGTTIGTVNSTTGQVSGTSNLGRATFTCSRGQHTINIHAPGATGAVAIQGVEALDTTKPSVIVANLGLNGLTTGQWSSATQFLVGYPVDLAIINLMINDATSSLAPSTWLANLTTIVNTVTPTASVILSSCNPSNGTTYEQQYNAVMQPYAATNGYNVVDVFARWGTWQTTLSVDSQHPNSLGYTDMARAESAFLENVGGSIVNPLPGPTVVAGSAGSLSWSMPSQSPAFKKVVISLSGYSAAGTTTITFPTAFTQTPDVTKGQTVAATLTAPTTTSIVLPAMTTQTGTITVEGM